MSRWRDLERTLAGTLSWEDVDRVMRAVTRDHGGEAIYVPRRTVDRGTVRAEVRAGTPQRVVGAAHGVSVRTVRRIVRGR